ncbi:MAG: orotidine-5'-phosphate decarboxylase [Clostridium sp.]|nr:orotidine-5'-phosphate decarboxylase [Clostridium sp.]
MTREELIGQIRRKGSFLCVGLDSDPLKLPDCLGHDAAAVLKFNKDIIDATAPFSVAYKPNLAFYEALGSEGLRVLEQTVAYIRDRYPGIFIIADAKRGDIGNTAALYARSFFEHMDVDAVTVAPYMGEDSVTPFLGFDGKWVILLALTSNKGSHDFQFIRSEEGTPLWESVIAKSQQWAGPDNMMYVVGATQGRMFEEIRRVAPESFLLVPGVGAQGGSLEEVARYGMTDTCGLLVNSSRGIIFASRGEDYAEAAARAARGLRDQMTTLLQARGIV